MSNQTNEASRQNKGELILDYKKLYDLAKRPQPNAAEVDSIIAKAREMKGLSTEEAAVLLAIESEDEMAKLLQCAHDVKEEIYGKRMVLFAPLYTGNFCTNNCLYCGFRSDNKDLKRSILTEDDIKKQVEYLLADGHKRLLMLCGESNKTPLKSTIKAIEAAYSVKHKGASIRRINVEIAPLEIDEFKELKKANIGTYTCFQETYEPELYKAYHPTGKKADYSYRLNVMHRAMEAGIDDVGVGILFGLADYKFEVLAMMDHAADLEAKYGCGPHTVSVPRIEPAPGAPLTEKIPFPVNDAEFRKIIAVIRIAMPYTGIILSTRENEALRKELFHYGVSQVSAGSITSVGGYSEEREDSTSQFSLGDHRSLEEVINDLVDDGFIPSFCTGCYRQGRVGNDFMDLAKPGLIKHYCMPNGLTSFAEYLEDYAGTDTKTKGTNLINKLVDTVPEARKEDLEANLKRVQSGERDLYY